MKFVIITHAVHKLNKQDVFAYEPYVKEMNLWLKYVDEVRIVAPVSKEDVSAIESRYKHKEQIPNRVGHDGTTCHSELVEESHDLEGDDEIATSLLTSTTLSASPHNDRKGCHPEPVSTYGHSALDAESHDLKKNVKSLRQAQTDSNECHPEHVEGSHDMEGYDEILKQVQHDETKTIQLIKIPSIDITSLKNGVRAVFKIPNICYQIFKAMQWADHIHLRCPGNIGLLGCFVQLLFPYKPKTVKYAGNWDPKSKQPLSYRLQKWLLSNTFLTRNVKVLVYGEWPHQSKNIVPFFTASYSEDEMEEVEIDEKGKSLRQAQTDKIERHRERSEAIFSKEQIATSITPRNDENECHPEPVEGGQSSKLKFIFVGGLTSGKQPLLTVQVIHKLKQNGYNIQLDMFGDGVERTSIENYILDNALENVVFLHGNSSKEIVKQAYQKAHFLLFISKSEGWPKVVAEAMFWGCLPITSKVSCIPYMLDNGNRGSIVNTDANEIISVIETYLQNSSTYKEQAQKAKNWSRQYTLEKFEEEIGKLLNSPLERG